MPIFYKDGQRVLFAHVPKSAGSSVAAWFHSNDWVVSNLYFGDDEVGRYFKSAGVHRLQIEGAQTKGVSPQHAHAEATSQWGTFTSSFLIVRSPFERLKSQLKYAAQQRLGTSCSSQKLDQFVGRYITEVRRKIADAPWLEDNHFRPQHEFLASGMSILRFEESEWQRDLQKLFQLEGTPPRLLGSCVAQTWSPTIDDGTFDWLCDYYAEDFRQFGYRLPNKVTQA